MQADVRHNNRILACGAYCQLVVRYQGTRELFSNLSIQRVNVDLLIGSISNDNLTANYGKHVGSTFTEIIIIPLTDSFALEIINTDPMTATMLHHVYPIVIHCKTLSFKVESKTWPDILVFLVNDVYSLSTSGEVRNALIITRVSYEVKFLTCRHVY